jgi:uncharacterized protein
VIQLTVTKKELKQKENIERLNNAISTLDSLIKNVNIQRNIRNMIREVLAILKDERGGSISVRAANAISMLDGVTQCNHISGRAYGKLYQR